MNNESPRFPQGLGKKQKCFQNHLVPFTASFDATYFHHFKLNALTY